MKIAITGATGSLGQALIRRLIHDDLADRIVAVSRDEVKQAEQAAAYREPHPIRWFLGDVRDRDRLRDAFRECDAVVNCAALKRVDAIAYSPGEALKTNVLGAKNVIAAAADSGVARVLMISSDKAVAPANYYGTTKALMEGLAVASNSATYARGTIVSVVRYGNVIGSRGSVLHVFRAARDAGQPIPITDPRCTRFWITLRSAVAVVLAALRDMSGGEIFIPLLPAMRLIDFAQAVAPGTPHCLIGLRPGGEKFHETLLGEEEAGRTRWERYRLVVRPSLHSWRASWPEGIELPPGFRYRSDDTGIERLTVEQMRAMIETVLD